MTTTQTDHYVVKHRFTDFEEFSDAIHAWDLDFRQLDAGDSPAELTQVGTGRFQLTHACLNRKYDQYGGAPDGTRTFALLETGVKGLIWCGRPVTDQTLLMFDSSGAFEATSQPGFRVFTFALPEDQLLETVQALGIQEPKQITYHSDNAIELTPLAARNLHLRMVNIARVATADPTVLNSPGFLEEFKYELPGQLAEAIKLSETNPLRPALRTRYKALKHALDYINTSADVAHTVRDLCRATGVSERTLEYAFRERFGVTPKQYIRDIRLNAVHKILAKAASEEAKVTDIANQFGFWHMGQFAADYKRLFGKLPSEVLREPYNKITKPRNARCKITPVTDYASKS